MSAILSAGHWHKITTHELMAVNDQHINMIDKTNDEKCIQQVAVCRNQRGISPLHRADACPILAPCGKFAAVFSNNCHMPFINNTLVTTP